MKTPSKERILAALNTRLDEDDEDEDDSGFKHDSALDKHLFEARTLLVHGPISDKLAAHCSARIMIMQKLNPEKPNGTSTLLNRFLISIS